VESEVADKIIKEKEKQRAYSGITGREMNRLEWSLLSAERRRGLWGETAVENRCVLRENMISEEGYGERI